MTPQAVLREAANLLEAGGWFDGYIRPALLEATKLLDGTTSDYGAASHLIARHVGCLDAKGLSHLNDYAPTRTQAITDLRMAACQ